MHHNCTRTGFEVHTCTASSPNVRKKYSFLKLIHVIRIIMRKFFVVQCHPRNTFNIKLFLNYYIVIISRVLARHTTSNLIVTDGLCLLGHQVKKGEDSTYMQIYR